MFQTPDWHMPDSKAETRLKCAASGIETMREVIAAPSATGFDAGAFQKKQMSPDSYIQRKLRVMYNSSRPAENRCKSGPGMRLTAGMCCI